MAKQRKRSGKPKQKNKGGTGKLIGRISLYSVLAILLVVGVWEFRVKNAASATGHAWRTALKQTPEHEDFLQSQLDQYIKGIPTTETRTPGEKDEALVVSVVRYSWNGIIRTYEIDVEMARGKDRSIETITGP